MEEKEMIDEVEEFKSPAPARFSQHPDFDFKAYQKKGCRALRKLERGKTPQEAETGVYQYLDLWNERKISTAELFNPLHPDVFIIPRNRFNFVVDEWDDAIGFERTVFPFSSTDFYVDIDKEGSVFYEIAHTEPFQRLGGISQLGYLVPPRPKKWNKDISIAYLLPTFPHTRWAHSLLTAIITELVLARNGFSKDERIPMVLTAGFHDIATPAGGDSVKRVDSDNLGEEDNFDWVIKRYGLDKRWQEKFGFDPALAQTWVKGKGTFGPPLDFIDKICYAALDCYEVGVRRNGNIRRLCLRHPLVMDVWQDIVSPDKENFFFSNPDNLFNFLLLRAYEFQDFLFNPYSRALDLFLKQAVQPLYRRGIVTKEDLLTQDDNWLQFFLEKHYPGEIKWYLEPENLSWKKFKTEEEQEAFCKELGRRFDHKEYISGLKTGLDFPVLDKGKVVPLREAIPQEKAKLLDKIAASVKGYYVYYNFIKRP